MGRQTITTQTNSPQQLLYRGGIFPEASMIHMRDAVESILDSGMVNGQPVPVLPWSEIGDFQVDHVDYLFFSKPPGGFGKEMPRHINGAPGKASGGASLGKESVIPNVFVMVKYYTNNLKVTRYSKVYNGSTKFLFQVTLQQSNNKPARSAVKRVKREVLMSPNDFIEHKPVCTSITPNAITVDHGKHEEMKAKGEHLTASCGKLCKTSGLYNDKNLVIPAYILNGTDGRQVNVEIDQPNDLSTSTYILELVVHDDVYRFEDHPVTFTEVVPLPSTLQVSEATAWDAQKDFPAFDYYIPQPAISLTEAFELGNTRCAALMSLQYDGMPGLLDGKGEMTMSLVDLARKSKNLNTLLFAIVWEQVTVGKREQNLFNTLREHVMTTNKLRFNDMLMCIKGTRDEEDSLKEAEKEIRSAVKDALFAKTSKKLADAWAPVQALDALREQVVAHQTSTETIETFFTQKDTPSYLIDPITEAIFVHPVILPISGRSVSVHVVERRPNFDMFANQEFKPEQHTLRNRHLQDQIESYLEGRVNEILDGLPKKEAFEKSLHLLQLLQDRQDLSCYLVAMNEFSKFVWKFPNEIFTLLLSQKSEYISVFFQAITRDNRFPPTEFITLLYTEKQNADMLKALCMIFPDPESACTLLEIGNLLSSIEKLDQALYLTRLFFEQREFNLLATFIEKNQFDMQNVWKILKTASKIWPRQIFDEICRGLPVDSDIIDILTSDLGNVAYSLLAAEQAHKLAKIQEVVKSQTAGESEFAKKTEVENLSEKYDAQFQEYKAELSELRTQVQKLEELLDVHKKELEITRKEKEDLVAQLAKQAQEHKKAAKGFNKKHEELTAKVAQLEKQLEDQKKEYDAKTADIANKQTQNETSQKQLNTKITELSAKVPQTETNLTTKLNEISTKITQNETNFTTKVNEVSTKVTQNETSLTTKLTEISTKVGQNETNLTNKLNELTTKLTQNETNFNAKFTQTETNFNTKVTTLTDKFTQHENAQTATITQIKQDITNATNKFTQLENDVKQGSTNINNKITKLEQDVSKLATPPAATSPPAAAAAKPAAATPPTAAAPAPAPAPAKPAAATPPPAAAPAPTPAPAPAKPAAATPPPAAATPPPAAAPAKPAAATPPPAAAPAPAKPAAATPPPAATPAPAKPAAATPPPAAAPAPAPAKPAAATPPPAAAPAPAKPAATLPPAAAPAPAPAKPAAATPPPAAAAPAKPPATPPPAAAPAKPPATPPPAAAPAPAKPPGTPPPAAAPAPAKPAATPPPAAAPAKK